MTTHTGDSLMELAAKIHGFKINDVTPLLGPNTPMYLVHPNPVVEPVCRYEPENFYSASNLMTLSDHSGAHVDAPVHFDPEGLWMHEVPVDSLFLRPYKKFDLSSLDPQAGQIFARKDLEEAAERGGFEVEPGDIAIIEYGWDQYRPGGTAGKEPGWWGHNQPGMDDSACSYLADAGIVAVASDSPGVDCGTLGGEILTLCGHTTHFLPRGILIIESLEGLGGLPATGLFAALPLKLEEGTASPIRVLLITE